MQTLNDIPLFADMDERLAERYARNCFWKDYDPHELIIDTDDESQDVRFIISGARA